MIFTAFKNVFRRFGLVVVAVALAAAILQYLQTGRISPEIFALSILASFIAILATGLPREIHALRKEAATRTETLGKLTR